MSETSQLAINDRGIFVVSRRKIQPQAIFARRHRLQNKIVSLRADIQDSQMRIRHDDGEIKNLEAELRDLNSDTVNKIIEQDLKQKKEAEEKAKTLLHETIGDRVYTFLEENGHFIFTAKDNVTYKVDKKGNVYRKKEREWKRLCIIRPGELPLPDFILSAFINVRENPTKYPLRRR